MNSSVGASVPPNLHRYNSPGEFGRAIILDQGKIREGLWARHFGRNQQQRQVFTFEVFFGPDQKLCDSQLMRRTKVKIGSLPKDIDIVIGEHFWHRYLNEKRLPGEHDKESISCDLGTMTIATNWHVLVCWPVASDCQFGSLLTPTVGLPKWRLGILHCSKGDDNDCCIVNRQSLTKRANEHASPPLLCQDQNFTYYFPGVET